MTKEEIQIELKKINDELLRLSDRKKNLETELKKLRENDATTLLLNEVMQVNENNSMVVELDETTRTTPIMDEFCNSQKKFLVFENLFYLNNPWTRASLIVVKARAGCRVFNSRLTMTILKKHAGRVVSDSHIRHLSETSRFYPLASELVKAAQKIATGVDRIPFETPVRLGGQTYANQAGYGSCYEGTYLVSQGTLYGETTGFYIIGIKVNKNSY